MEKVKLLNKKKSPKSLSLYKIVFVSLCSDSESLRQTGRSTQRNGHKLVERKTEDELEDAVKISIGVNSESTFQGLSHAKFSWFVKCETYFSLPLCSLIPRPQLVAAPPARLFVLPLYFGATKHLLIAGCKQRAKLPASQMTYGFRGNSRTCDTLKTFK